jgi:hypothetical protein
MNNIIILDSEIQQAKKLTVEDEEGSLLFNNLLVIDASGLVNSLRKTRDGHVFFGPIAEYVLYYITIEKLFDKRFHYKLQQRLMQNEAICNILRAK